GPFAAALVEESDGGDLLVVLTDASVRRGDVFAEDPDPALLAIGPDDVLAAVDSLGVTDPSEAR
ncbi:hypothetical protein ACEN85_17660, partial [Curtobacterium sp. CT11-45]